MRVARPVLAHSVVFTLVALAAGSAHARRIPAPKPPPTTIPALDEGEIPRTIAVPMPGSSLVRGRSSVLVRASLSRVREVVLDFARYPELLPHVEACKMLGLTAAGGRDVYMRVAALRGAVKMWARIEVARPSYDGGVETYRSRLVDGNVDDLSATWRVERIDDTSTRLEVEIFMRPKLPLPASVLNGENLEGARLAVTAFKARAEAK